MLGYLAALAVLAGADPSPSPEVIAEFRARDQALLDAVGTGDQAVWDATLSEDATYVDEEGNVSSKAQVVAEIQPLPPRNVGRIAIFDYTLKLFGDFATVVLRDDETETWHGQTLKARYLVNETWRREPAGWKLLMTHVYVVAHDPLAADLPTTTLDQYVGRYTAGPGAIYLIRRDGEHLTLAREGKSAQPFLPAANDVLFVPGRPRFQHLMQRDADGRIDGFLERREGENIRWKRVLD